MGLSDRLWASATRRPHVLLAAVPGHAPTRWAAETALDQRGWPSALSPAEADVLLVCGPAGRELTPAVEQAWQAMPGPRVRAGLDAPEQAGAVLSGAQDALRNLSAHRRDAHARPAPALSAGGEGSDADMGMSLPGGLVMADRLEDRDGLRLEGLHLSFGPLLPHWPAGLVLDVALSGDVLTAAAVRRLGPRPDPPSSRPVPALDALALLLAAAGWQDGALRARRARAEGGTGPVTDDLLRRLRHRRVLRWSLRRLPGPGGGDLADHLDRLVAAVRGDGDLAPADEQELAAAVTGLDLGAAHPVVAAYGPLLSGAAVHV